MDIMDPSALGLSESRLARINDWMASYVDAGKLPCMQVLVARNGKVAYFDMVGSRDVERNLDVEADTLFRIYSMTKPITSAAIMTFYEEGRFHLDEPVSRFIPAFAELNVFAGGTADSYETVPAERPITFRDLLTHTSGLTYDFIDETVVGELYRKNRLFHVSGKQTMPEFIERLATVPLLAHPGSEWNYSVSTDVLGYLVELLGDRPFADVLQTRIFDRLGMEDTAFYVPDAKRDRFAACYTVAEGGGLKLTDDPTSSRFLGEPIFASGGGGLVSTAEDYFRFCQMLLNKGEFGGERVLGRKTVEYMMANHLGGDMASMGQPRFSETSYEGIGFGLGGSVVVDAPMTQTLQSEGTFAWGGMASTGFWIDPEEDIVAVLMTQLTPSSTYPIRNELRVLVNQALVD